MGIQVKNRDVTIDILRGVAVFLMFGGNTLFHITPIELHPQWFIFCSSLAAPLFIVLSTYMICVNSVSGKHDLKYYLLRGGMVILTGALMDTFGGVLPFYSYDILYLTGFSMPVVYLVSKMKLKFLPFTAFTVFMISFILHHCFVYESPKKKILFFQDITLPSFSDFLKSWLFDGYFPVFPWMGWVIVSVYFAHFRCKKGSLFGGEPILAGVILSLLGFLLLAFKFTNNSLFDRLSDIVLEDNIFYPATPPFFIWCGGVILLLFAFVDKTSNIKFLFFFSVLGKRSMFNYLLHMTIVWYVVRNLFSGDRSLAVGWLSCMLLTCVCFGASLSISLLSEHVNWNNIFLLRFYLGN